MIAARTRPLPPLALAAFALLFSLVAAQPGLGQTSLAAGSGARFMSHLAAPTRGPGLPGPPPPISPLNDIDQGLIAAGDFVDLTAFGGPKVGIKQTLLQALQGDLTGFFSVHPGNLATDMFLSAIADKWTSTLVTFQYSPGLQGFLDYFVPGSSVLQTKLLQAACTIYPWSAMLPPPVKTLKDSYCIKAIPADILSNGPLKLPLPLPKIAAPMLP